MIKSICVVCIANYCRSPVLEQLLIKRYEDKYEFYSAGLYPMSDSNMDVRSLNFLKKNNVNIKLHTPKKLNKKILEYFDLFLAVDLIVLQMLNKNFSNYSHKFRLASFQFPKINIIDPYKLNDAEYASVMDDILLVSQKIDLENI